MKKFILLAIAAFSLTHGVPINAQTKISELDDLEKAAVLLGFCRQIGYYASEKDASGNRYSKSFDFKNLRDVNHLVNEVITADNYHREKYGRDHLARIYLDAESDFTKRKVLDDFTLSQEVIDKCISDGKKVISDQYIDHFNYMD